MRKLILVAGATLTLAACGQSRDETNMGATNTMMTDQNMMMSDNMMMDPNMAMPMNGMNGMDANMTMDPATQNAMMQDMNTNDPDTNLANGM